MAFSTNSWTAAAGRSTTVADARFAKPLDMDLIRRLAREHEVLVLMARGLDNGAIGERLRIAENTVRNHLAAVYSKLGVGSAREAVAWAWETGLVRAG